MYGEYVTKVVAAGLVDASATNAIRHRYSLEHRLVRGNAIGDWANAINSAVTGPAAQFFGSSAKDIVLELAARVADGDWRHAVVTGIYAVAKALKIDTDEIGLKVALRQFFQINATIRNKTRGHGAMTSGNARVCAQQMHRAIDDLVANVMILNLPWANLHRNLKGKYRVTPLCGSCSVFDYLKSTTEAKVPDGVAVYLDGPLPVPLLTTDADALDIFAPNGNFREASFDVLSYVSNESKRRDGTPAGHPPDRLPSSETEGPRVLEPIGNLFGTFPLRLSAT